MKTLLTSIVLMGLGLGSAALASTGADEHFSPIRSVPGTYGNLRTGEPVLLIRDILPWNGDIMPFFTAAGTVVTSITSDMITSTDLSDYCLIAVTAGTTGYGGDTYYQDNVNAAVGLFTAYVQSGGVMLYQTGTWGGSIMMPGGAYTVLQYDAENTFVGPHYMSTSMPYPVFNGNYASHDDLLDLPASTNVIALGSFGQVVAAEWTLGSGAVLALTQPVECYIPGGVCYGQAPHFNQFETNAIEYARSLGECGDPLPVAAQLSPVRENLCLGESQTMTVTITDENDLPIVGQSVVIDVILGPNQGLSSGTLTTDMFGVAGFTYSSNLSGTDQLVASFTNAMGGAELSNTARLIWDVCTADTRDLAGSFSLQQNYPNPFNPSTSIEFALPQTGFARLTVQNLAGQTVATLVNGMASAGVHSVTFDASGLSSGVYYYTLEQGNLSETRKLVLVK
jgi:hypothetical protein